MGWGGLNPNLVSALAPLGLVEFGMKQWIIIHSSPRAGAVPKLTNE